MVSVKFIKQILLNGVDNPRALMYHECVIDLTRL